MSNNTNEPKALVIPDAEQIQRDAELFGVTRQWIEWAGAVATGQQEGSKEDVVNALAVAHENITALEANHLIAHAAVAGLKEAADKLMEQRDQAVAEKVQLEAEIDDRLEEAQQDGWDAAMEYSQEYWDDELDLDEAWQQIKDEMENYAEMLGMKLKLIGQVEAAKELHSKVQTAIRAYDDADSTIIKYNQYCNEHMAEIDAKRKEWQQGAAERAAQHPLVEDDDDADSDDDENDEAF